MKIIYEIEETQDERGYIWFVGTEFPKSFRLFKKKVNAKKYHLSLSANQPRYFMRLKIQD